MKIFLTLLLSCAVFCVSLYGQSQSFKGNLKWQIEKDKVASFEFTPDSKFILLVGKFNNNLFDFDGNSWFAGEIEVIETETGKQLSNLSVCDGKFGLSFFQNDSSSRTNLLAVSCRKGTAELWDVRQAKLLKTFYPAAAKEINRCVLSSDGKRLVTFEEDSFRTPYRAVLQNAEKGTVIKILYPKLGGSFAANASFSEDGKMVAVSYDGYVYLWNAINGELLYKLVDKDLKGFPTRSHNSMVYVMLFTPDGKKLITGSVDKLAKIWNTENGNLEYTLVGHKSRIDMGALSDDGKMLTTIDDNKGVKFWDVETGKLSHELKAKSYPYLKFLFNPDNRFLFSPTEKGASVWDVKTGKEIWSDKNNRATLSSSWKWFLSYNKKEKKLEMFEFSNR